MTDYPIPPPSLLPLQPPLAIRAACTDRLQRYSQARDSQAQDSQAQDSQAQDSQAQDSGTLSWPWQDSRPIDPANPALPDSIVEAYQHYKINVMDQDWGCINGAHWIEPAAKPAAEPATKPAAEPAAEPATSFSLSLIVLHISTDGEDGWLELFDPSGHPLGTARTYGSHIHWGDPKTLREQVFTAELPPELEAQMLSGN
jgi:hypothetical protein